MPALQPGQKTLPEPCLGVAGAGEVLLCRAFIVLATPKPDCDYGRQYRVKAGKRALTRHCRPCCGFVSGLRGPWVVLGSVVPQRAVDAGSASAGVANDSFGAWEVSNESFATSETALW